jgi:5'(3')-deoxyribonucleotidase
MLRDKYLLNVDVLIDDCLDNFKGFKGFRVIVDSPWNRKGILGVDYDYRAYNFNDVEKAINLLALGE